MIRGERCCGGGDAEAGAGLNGDGRLCFLGRIGLRGDRNDDGVGLWRSDGRGVVSGVGDGAASG